MESIHFGQGELSLVANKIISVIDGIPLILIGGSMGAGKTTLIKEMLNQLGSRDEITSPTYAIANQYATPTKGFEVVYHLDLYRLKNLNELISLPIEDYIYSGNPCFIEWPELLEEYEHDLEVFRLKLETQSDGSRKILFL